MFLLCVLGMLLCLQSGGVCNGEYKFCNSEMGFYDITSNKNRHMKSVYS